VAVSEPTPEPEQQAKAPDSRSRNAPRTNQKSNNRGGRGGSSGGGNDRQNRMLGMGDHMPTFIALSFDERRGGPAAPSIDDGEDEAPESFSNETAA
jgi:hypothetical protein